MISTVKSIALWMAHAAIVCLREILLWVFFNVCYAYNRVIELNDLPFTTVNLARLCGVPRRKDASTNYDHNDVYREVPCADLIQFEEFGDREVVLPGGGDLDSTGVKTSVNTNTYIDENQLKNDPTVNTVDDVAFLQLDYLRGNKMAQFHKNDEAKKFEGHTAIAIPDEENFYGEREWNLKPTMDKVREETLNEGKLRRLGEVVTQSCNASDDFEDYDGHELILGFSGDSLSTRVKCGVNENPFVNTHAEEERNQNDKCLVKAKDDLKDIELNHSPGDKNVHLERFHSENEVHTTVVHAFEETFHEETATEQEYYEKKDFGAKASVSHRIRPTKETIIFAEKEHNEKAELEATQQDTNDKMYNSSGAKPKNAAGKSEMRHDYLDGQPLSVIDSFVTENTGELRERYEVSERENYWKSAFGAPEQEKGMEQERIFSPFYDFQVPDRERYLKDAFDTLERRVQCLLQKEPAHASKNKEHKRRVHFRPEVQKCRYEPSLSVAENDILNSQMEFVELASEKPKRRLTRRNRQPANQRKLDGKGKDNRKGIAEHRHTSTGHVAEDGSHGKAHDPMRKLKKRLSSSYKSLKGHSKALVDKLAKKKDK